MTAESLDETVWPPFHSIMVALTTDGPEPSPEDESSDPISLFSSPGHQQPWALLFEKGAVPAPLPIALPGGLFTLLLVALQ